MISLSSTMDDGEFRSYYRCTSASCNVKKRVERSFKDPTTVVTTYEGQHTHPSPIMPRGPNPSAIPTSTFAVPRLQTTPFHHQEHVQLFNYGHGSTSLCAPTASLLTDYGLLQDIVPSNMRNEEEI